MRMASNRNVMAWTFVGNTRMHQVLREKGNKLSHVGIFTFEVSADGTISETGTAVSTILPYVKKWPHIKWILTITWYCLYFYSTQREYEWRTGYVHFRNREDY